MVPGGSFTTGDSSSALGLYNQQRSGNAAGLSDGGNASVDGNVEQISDATSSAITLATDGFSEGNGFFRTGVVFTDVSSLFSVQFMLTSASVVHIFGGATLNASGTAATDGFGIPASGSQSIMLTGPGVNFAPSIPDLSVDLGCGDGCGVNQTQSVPFDSSFTLLPGLYTLQADSDAGAFSEGNVAGSFRAGFNMSLTADFTSLTAVPEPSMATPVLVGAVVVVAWRMRRRVRHA
jgi:hypothetical protein